MVQHSSPLSHWNLYLVDSFLERTCHAALSPGGASEKFVGFGGSRK